MTSTSISTAWKTFVPVITNVVQVENLIKKEFIKSNF